MAPAPIEQLEEELLQRQLPRGCIIDLDLGSSTFGRVTADELRRWARDVNFEYVRGSHVDTLEAFRHLILGHVERIVGGREIVVLLSARTHHDWPTRKAIVDEVTAKYSTSSAVPVFLRRAAILDVDLAKRLIAEAVLHHWGLLAPIAIDTDHDLGVAVREAAGGSHPFVLAVGGNERQQRAAAAFPDRVNQAFGLEGQWIFTDYDRPGRVVEEIRTIHERVGAGLVAVVFAQYFNATDVKRDGQAFLRRHDVLSITKDFKSVGSALEAVRVALTMYVKGEVAEVDGQADAATENE